MPKYAVTVIYSESGYVEVEADNEDDALALANKAMDNDELETYGPDSIDFEIEEIGEEDEDINKA